MDEQYFDKTPAYAGCYGAAKNVTSGPLTSGSPCPPSAGQPKCETFGLVACGVPESVFDRSDRLITQALDETFDEGLDIGRQEGIDEMRRRIATNSDRMRDDLVELALLPLDDPNAAADRDSIVDAIERLLVSFESL